MPPAVRWAARWFSGRILILLTLGCVVFGCKADPAEEILRIAPNITPEVARHLARDDDEALRRSALILGLDAIAHSHDALMMAPLRAPHESFAAVESIAAPHCDRLAMLLETEFAHPNFPARNRAYRTYSLAERRHILQLKARIVDNKDSTLAGRVRQCVRLIEETRPYGTVLGRGTLFATYSEDVSGSDSRACEQNLRIGIAEAELHGDYTIACQMLGMLGAIHWDRNELSEMRDSWDRALAHARRIKSYQEPRILAFYANYFRSRGQVALTRDLLLQAQDRCHELRVHTDAEIRYLVQWLDFMSDLECWDVVERDLPRTAPLLRRARSQWGQGFQDKWQPEIDRIEIALAATAQDCAKVERLGPRILSAIASAPPSERRDRSLLRAIRPVLQCGLSHQTLNRLESERRACERDTPKMLRFYDLLIARARLEVGDSTDCEEALERFRASPHTQGGDVFEAYLEHDVLNVQSSIQPGRHEEARDKLETAFARLVRARGILDVGPETSLILARSRPLLEAAHTLVAKSPQDGYGLEMLWRPLQTTSTALSDTTKGGARPLVEEIHMEGRTLRDKLKATGAIHCVFNVVGDRVRRWTAFDDGVVCDTLAIDAEALAERVEVVTRRVSDPTLSPVSHNVEFLHASHALAEILLPPVVFETPTSTRLLVSADGFLLQLPFEALSLSRDRFQPLGARHEVASLRFEVRAQEVATGTPLAVWAPEYPRAQRLRYPALMEELRYSADEIEGLRGAFPETRGFTGREATKSHLLALWQNASLIYFATHVVRDPQVSYLTFLPLALPGSEEASVQDSNLEIADVRRADLRGCELVVLSGCATGASYVQGTASSPSLGEAFLDAGAHAVVHTYWPVRDDAAATFMARFIAHYAKSMDPVEAMTIARREAVEEGLDPRQWLAYSVMVNSADPGAVVAGGPSRGTPW